MREKGKEGEKGEVIDVSFFPLFPFFPYTRETRFCVLLFRLQLGDQEIGGVWYFTSGRRGYTEFAVHAGLAELLLQLHAEVGGVGRVLLLLAEGGRARSR